MSYFAPYIDETGAHIPSYNDVLEYMIGKFKNIYGNDVYLEEDSQDYQFISSLSLLYYDCCQTFLLAYNNQSPTTAIGASLDRLCAINGITRKAKSYSTVTLQLTGKPNATINYVRAKDINGYLWQLNESITFDANGSATAVASSVVAGNINAAAGTITEMATPLQDWYSVTNPNAAVPGEEVESDSELRERRQQSVSYVAQSIMDSIVSSLKSLVDENGVSITKRVIAYENDTANIVDGLPAHSVAFVIESDTSDNTKQAIGQAIYLKKTPGTTTYKVNSATYGISVLVPSSLGIMNTINYSIPEPISATVSLGITTLSNYTSDLADVIKENIKNYINELNIGEDLYISNLYLPILQATIILH